jgi:hypothetical protein
MVHEPALQVTTGAVCSGCGSIPNASCSSHRTYDTVTDTYVTSGTKMSSWADPAGCRQAGIDWCASSIV